MRSPTLAAYRPVIEEFVLVGLSYSRGDDGRVRVMGGWVDASPIYTPRHEHLLIGPLRPAEYAHLRSVTFWVNPDQLAVLHHGAYYDHAWGDPPAVIVPFGSGCMELVATFDEITSDFQLPKDAQERLRPRASEPPGGSMTQGGSWRTSNPCSGMAHVSRNIRG